MIWIGNPHGLGWGDLMIWIRSPHGLGLTDLMSNITDINHNTKD